MTYEDRDRLMRWFEAGGGEGLPPTKRAILADHAQFMNDKSRQAWLTAQRLARRWGLSEKTIKNLRTELINDGRLRRTRRGHYVVILPPHDSSTGADATSPASEDQESPDVDARSRTRDVDDARPSMEGPAHGTTAPTAIDGRSRTRDRKSRTRDLEVPHTGLHQKSESSRTRREVRDDDSGAGPPGDAGAPPGAAPSDAPSERPLPDWVEWLMTNDSWSREAAESYGAERFAKARGGDVPEHRRLPFIRKCRENDRRAARAAEPRPPRPVKARCFECERARELHALIWLENPLTGEPPSAHGYGLCGECWADRPDDLDARWTRSLVDNPPCQRCGNRFAREDGHGADVTLCPRCWRAGDPYGDSPAVPPACAYGEPAHGRRHASWCDGGAS